MTTRNKHEMVGGRFCVGASVYTLVGWHRPDHLRAGDLIHVDAQALSAVTSVKSHRGGTRLIALADGRDICVAGESDLAVFVMD